MEDLSGWDVLVVQKELESGNRRKLWGSPVRVYAARPAAPGPIRPGRPRSRAGRSCATACCAPPGAGYGRLPPGVAGRPDGRGEPVGGRALAAARREVGSGQGCRGGQEGLTPREIGDRLLLSEFTVRMLRQRPTDPVGALDRPAASRPAGCPPAQLLVAVQGGGDAVGRELAVLVGADGAPASPVVAGDDRGGSGERQDRHGRAWTVSRGHGRGRVRLLRPRPVSALLRPCAGG